MAEIPRSSVNALTRAWNGCAREQYFVDPFPRYPPFFCYQTQLVLVYPLRYLGLSSFASFLRIRMQSHLRLALDNKPASRTTDWRTVVSFKMLPKCTSIKNPQNISAEVEDQHTSVAKFWRIQVLHMIDIWYQSQCWNDISVRCIYERSMQINGLGHPRQTLGISFSFSSHHWRLGD